MDIGIRTYTSPCRSRSGNYSNGTAVSVSDTSENSSYSGSSPQVEIVKKYDSTALTDSNVLSSIRVMLEIANYAISKNSDQDIGIVLNLLKGLKINGKPLVSLLTSEDGATNADDAVMSAMLSLKSFLRKDIEDTSYGLIHYLKGADFGSEGFVSGVGGKGAKIDEKGGIEAQTIKINQFAEFAELRWNKTSIYLGTEVKSYGGGIIESVTPDKDANGVELLTGTIKLHLNAGEIGKIAVDDICWGIFHDGMDEVNDSSDYDDLKGVIKYAGYFTTFFRITSITETTYNSTFTYALRQVSDAWTKSLHPRAMMHFAQRGNFTNTSRQDFKLSTLRYEKIYEKVATWELTDDNVTYFNGYKEYFSKSGITLGNGRTMYISNVVIDGTIQQFENLGVTMSFDTGGDNFLAYGESKTVKSIIKDGYGRDVTANFDTWAVTRESGDTQADLVWNAKAVINGGVFTVQWTDTKNDLGSGLSTLFNVTATKGTTTTTATIEF